MVCLFRFTHTLSLISYLSFFSFLFTCLRSLTSMTNNAESRVESLVKQNVLLQNDLSRLNLDMTSAKLAADEKAKHAAGLLKDAHDQIGA
jgi:cell division protein FtsX